jgi:hypothetical protein
VVGIVLGVLIATQPWALKPALQPLLKLAKTFRPLLLPLAVVVIVGTIKLSPLAQILVCAVTVLLAVRLILVPEAAKSGVTLSFNQSLASKAVLHGMLLVLGGGLLVVVGMALFAPTAQYFRSIGGFSATVLLLALAIWALAFGLRLVSYATSWLRALVALSLALLGVRVAMWAGVIPWDKALSDKLPWLLPGLAILAGLLLLSEAALNVVVAARERRPGQPADKAEEADGPLGALLALRTEFLGSHPISVAGGLGVSAALAAAAVLFLSTAYGLWVTNAPGEDRMAENGDHVHSEMPSTPPAQIKDDLRLAKTFSPVLAFTDEERWPPIDVDRYLQGSDGLEGATLVGPAGTEPRHATLADLPTSCPGLAPLPCYQLTIDCPNGHAECGDADTHQSGRYYDNEGAVYYRVVRKDERRQRGTPNVFVHRGRYRDSLSALIQYWYFYRYDEWEARAFAGLLTQRHEGDWEIVTVGLSNSEPLFVGYSAHCAGRWVPWESVEVSDRFGRPWTHPLVAVAEGSHANYPKADQKRSPDWASCAGVPAGATTMVSYASNIRDKTEYGWEWSPPENGWHVADAAAPPMSFPGTWGATDTTTLHNFKTISMGPPRHGPLTPSLQGPWQTPVAAIFCGSYSGPAGNDRCGEGE